MIATEPFKLIKNGIDYCKYSKKDLITILAVIIIFQLIPEAFSFPPRPTLIFLIMQVTLFTGYGLCVIADITNDGKQLPRLQVKKTLSMGIRGAVVMMVYLSIQIAATGLISYSLGFPDFELEEMILNFSHTLHMLLNHNPLHSIIFMIAGVIITYVTVFFMEIGLGMIANGEPFKNSFNLKLIKQKIDRIGWADYGVEYSIVISSIIILTAIGDIFSDFGILQIVVKFLIFIIEFVAMGVIYKKSR